MSPSPGAPEQKARAQIDAALSAAGWIVQDILAQEIADDLRSALGQIEDILGDLERRLAPSGGA